MTKFQEQLIRVKVANILGKNNPNVSELCAGLYYLEGVIREGGDLNRALITLEIDLENMADIMEEENQ